MATDAHDRLMLALDVEPDHARRLVGDLRDRLRVVKVGWQLYLSAGNELIRDFVEDGLEVFLDLKFGDIAETVRKLVAVAAEKRVSYITLNASVEAVKAAVEARDRAGSSLKVLTVTLLTNLGEDYLRDQLGSTLSVEDFVLRRTRFAKEVGGCDGVIASGREAAAIRRQVGPGFLIVTPGIRPSGAPADDQHRTATPGEAIAAGADFLVVGRPITKAPKPREALEGILEEMQRAFDARA